MFNHPGRTAVAVDNHFPGKAWFCYIADYRKNGYDSSSFLRIVKYSSQDNSFELDYDGINSIQASGSKLVFEVTHHDTNTIDFYIGGTYLRKTDIDHYPDSLLAISAGEYPGECWIHVDMRDMVLFSDGNGYDTLYTANDAGISWGAAFEPGQTGCGNDAWHLRYPCNSIENGLNVTEFYGIGISDSEPKIVAGGCQDLNDMIYYDDRWINFGDGDGSQLVFDPTHPNIFYYSEFQYSSLYRTDTYGAEENPRLIYNMHGSSIIIPMELDPIDPSVLYSGGLYLLKFFGVNDFLHDVPNPDSLQQFNNIITDIEVVRYGSSSRRMYVSTDKAYYPWSDPPPPDSLHYSGCIYRSYNDGISFSDISDSLAGCLNGFISDIEVNPEDNSQIWVSFTVYSLDSTQNKKVFASSNSGNSWQDFSQGLPPGMPVFKIRFVPGYNYLLAATDVGVFKRSLQDSIWHAYNQNLPAKIVTDLEVNPKFNTIVAATYGRGIWESPVYCHYSSEPLVINENDTWGKDTILDRSLIISSGKSLTLRNCRVYLPSQAKIIVQNGATLVLDGCTLSSACHDLWWGVEVWGDSRYMQSTGRQGKVELINNAMIEKARKAIFCGKNIENSYPDWAYTGGIVDARDAIFKNNRYGVMLWTYHYADTSKFIGCQFQTTEILADGSTPEYFMTLVQVHGIKIEGCTFEYLIKEEPDYLKHGRAIYSIDAGFEVFPSPESSRSTTFKNLNCGVFALKLFENQLIEIHQTDFEKNLTGLYTSGIENLVLYSNEFLVEFDSLPPGTQIFGGAYLDHCTGYTIEENYFHGNQTFSEGTTCIGLTINNSGATNNEIYKNTFFNMYIGTLAQNINRNGKDPEEGLKLNCNVYNNNEYDIVVTGAEGCGECGISKTQGSSSVPAGNLFSKTGLHPTSDFDNQMDSVFYFHHRAMLGGTNRWIPQYISDNVYLIPTQIPWSDTTCSSRLASKNKEFSKNLYTTSLSISDSLENLLQQLVDGGNTSLLDMEVNTALPDDALDLFDDLISYSPYLSDTILVKSVKKEDVLSQVMVKDIMVANPQSAKSGKVIEAMENRENPLPEYMIVEYIFKSNSGEGRLFIFSSDGKLRFSKALDRKKHDYIINTRDWEQGIYFYKFVLQGDKIQNGKIIIIK